MGCGGALRSKLRCCAGRRCFEHCFDLFHILLKDVDRIWRTKGEKNELVN